MEIEGTDRSELAMARRRDWLINVAKRFGLKDRGWWGKWNVRSCRPCMSICISICTTYMYIHVYTYTYIQQRMYFLKNVYLVIYVSILYIFWICGKSAVNDVHISLWRHKSGSWSHPDPHFMWAHVCWDLAQALGLIQQFLEMINLLFVYIHFQLYVATSTTLGRFRIYSQ